MYEFLYSKRLFIVGANTVRPFTYTRLYKPKYHTKRDGKTVP
nr:MAG TPA: hypothetical protein [Caudoviricetes sp.]DAO71833.1 MAG TPA: hypothetical protein [Caudoviricetes sp.]